jgi:drug/metabolite transporter (DMT)-like permease
MGLNVTPEALEAYRARVASTTYWLRWAGVALIIGGLACVVGNIQRSGQHGTSLEYAGIALTVAGWVLIAVAYWRRSAYSRRRMGN